MRRETGINLSRPGKNAEAAVLGLSLLASAVAPSHEKKLSPPTQAMSAPSAEPREKNYYDPEAGESIPIYPSKNTLTSELWRAAECMPVFRRTDVLKEWIRVYDQCAADLFKIRFNYSDKQVARYYRRLSEDANLRKRILNGLKKECGEHGVPIDVAFAILGVEGRGDPSQHSKKGASGIMQLMPITIRDAGYDATKPLTVENEIHIAIGKLAKDYHKFHNWSLTMIAYNMGRGGLLRFLRHQPHVKELVTVVSPDIEGGLGLLVKNPEAGAYVMRAVAAAKIIEVVLTTGDVSSVSKLFPPRRQLADDIGALKGRHGLASPPRVHMAASKRRGR